MAKQFVRASNSRMQADLAPCDGAVITTAGWVKLTTMPPSNAYPNRFCLFSGDYKYYALIGGSTLQVGLHNSGWIAIETTHGLSAGTWYHLAFVHDARGPALDYIRIFKGGTQLGSTRTTTHLPLVAVGTEGRTFSMQTGDSLDGELAEWAQWDAELSASDLAQLATGFSPTHVRSDALTRYWPFVRDNKETVGGSAMTPSGTINVTAHPRIYL